MLRRLRDCSTLDRALDAQAAAPVWHFYESPLLVKGKKSAFPYFYPSIGAALAHEGSFER